MSLIHSPQIVMDGLVLYVDPANPKSYAGTGTSLLDLSGSENNGTISGATFSGDNLGYFSFNGTSDYVYIPSSTSLRPTVAMSGEAFAYRANWNITTARKIFSKTQSAGYSMDLNIVAGNIGASIRIGSIYISASSPRTDLSSGWHHFPLLLTVDILIGMLMEKTKIPMIMDLPLRLLKILQICL